MSVSGNVSMGILRLAKPGKESFNDLEKIRRTAARENAAFAYKPPENRRVSCELVSGTDLPCPVIRPRTACREGSAVLYLYGGLSNTWNTQRSMAMRFAADTATEVWYPVYPSITEVNISETIEYLAGIYRLMAERYAPERIAFCGVSMGGQFALGIISAINQLGLDLPMPGLVIAHSPGGAADNDEDWKLLARNEKRDPFFSLGDVRMVESITPKRADGQPTPGWTLYPARGDFRGAPPTFLYYGEEVLAGNAALYRRAFEAAGEPDRLHVTEVRNMMHCYACMPIFPESKKDYFETVDLVKAL